MANIFGYIVLAVLSGLFAAWLGFMLYVAIRADVGSEKERKNRTEGRWRCKSRHSLYPPARKTKKSHPRKVPESTNPEWQVMPIKGKENKEI